MNRLCDNFRLRDSRWIQSRPAPRHINWQTGEINNTAIPAVAAKVVGRTHKDAIHWTWFNTQSAKHAFRVIDCIASDLKALAAFDFLFADVNTVDGTSLCALIASDTGRQVESMKTTVARGHWNRLFWVFKMRRKRASVILVGDQPIPQRYTHPLSNGAYGHEYISKPLNHRFYRSLS